MKEFLYFDKNPKDLKDVNRSLMFGESVFETFRYKQKLPIFFNDHMERLKKSCEFIGISFPGDFYIETIIEKFISEHDTKHINNMIKDLIIKVIVFSNGGASYGESSKESRLCVSVKENDDKPPKDFKVCLSRYVKASFNPLNKYKTSNYLMSVIEKKIAQNKGYNDALFVNEKNLAVETTSGNFFWIKGTNVFTPSIENGALPGIARNLIIKACKKNKIRLHEGDYEPGSIIFPEAMFITNAAKGIVEVTNLNNITRPTQTNKLFPKIKEEFHRLMEWD